MKMKPYKTSNKIFDYLIDHEEKVNLHRAEELLVGCKIIGVEFGAESLDDEKTVENIFLYLKREDGSKFMLDCGSLTWDEKYQAYDFPATLLVHKAEFPEEVM